VNCSGIYALPPFYVLSLLLSAPFVARAVCFHSSPVACVRSDSARFRKRPSRRRQRSIPKSHIRDNLIRDCRATRKVEPVHASRLGTEQAVP
jgi:hypothetical protein